MENIIRPYHPEDKLDILQILEKVYGPIIRKRHDFFWDWWQKRNDIDPDINHRSMVIIRGNRTAGYFRLQSRKFKVYDTIIWGAFGFDSVTSPEDRGIGIPLFRHILKSNDLLVGSPVQRATVMWKKIVKNDNIDIFHVIKAKRIINPSSFLPKQLQKIIPIPAKLIWRGIEFILEKISPLLKNSSIEAIEIFEDNINDFCLDWITQFKMAAFRDKDYLNWRFVDAPMPYQKRILKMGNSILGITAFRMAILNGRKILIISEIMVLATHALESYGSLLKHILEYARESQVSDVQTLETGCPIFKKALKSIGFILKDEKSTLIGDFKNDNSPQCPIFNPKEWYFGVGDFDLEFTHFKQGLESFEANFV